jgi:porin
MPRIQNPGPILQALLDRFFPDLAAPAQALNRKSVSWSVGYSFDQYLWQPRGDPTRGIGVFFSFGASDGNPTPIKYAFAAGIGGKGVAPSRADDSFGIGLARTQFSGDLVPFLRQRLDLGLVREDAIEMYYNAAVTRWLDATADLQIVNPGLGKMLDSSGSLTKIDTAVVAGIRLRTRF